MSRFQELLGFRRFSTGRHSQEFQDVVDGRAQAFEAARHFFQPFVAEVQGAAVVVGNEEEAQGIGAIVFQDVLDQEEVVQGLAHLFRIDGDEAVVKPVFDHGFLAGEGFGLGDFVFMVREDEVAAAAVEVEGIAKVLIAHSRAFDVPARTAFAPGAVPRRFAGLSTFPEGEVHGIVLAVVDFDTGAGHHVVEAATAQFAVVGELFDAVIDVVVDDVGIAFVDEGLDHVDDFIHVFRYAGILVGPADVELVHDVEVRCDIAVGNGIPRDAFAVGSVDDLIVDVGEVLDVRDFIAQVFQIALDDVPRDERTGIAHVGMVVRRNAADIHLDLARRNGHEDFFFTGQCIIYFQFSHTVTSLKFEQKGHHPL